MGPKSVLFSLNKLWRWKPFLKHFENNRKETENQINIAILLELSQRGDMQYDITSEMSALLWYIDVYSIGLCLRYAWCYYPPTTGPVSRTFNSQIDQKSARFLQWMLCLGLEKKVRSKFPGTCMNYQVRTPKTATFQVHH